MFKFTFLVSPDLGSFIKIWLEDKCNSFRVCENPLGLSGFWEITIYDISPEFYAKLYDFIQYHKRKGDLL